MIEYCKTCLFEITSKHCEKCNKHLLQPAYTQMSRELFGISKKHNRNAEEKERHHDHEQELPAGKKLRNADPIESGIRKQFGGKKSKRANDWLTSRRNEQNSK